jgi:putative transposase
MRAYKYKLYHHRKNKNLHQLIDLAGEIYNHLIALHRRYYRRYKKSLSRNRVTVHITNLKRMKRFQHWNQLGAQAIEDVANRIDKAYKLFFNNRKRGVKASPPKFKKRRNYKSFTLRQNTGYSLFDDNRIRIKDKVYKYKKHRSYEGKVKTVTIKRDRLGHLWLIIVVDHPAIIPNRTGKSAVGFDFGLKTFMTGSDGTRIESPQFFKSNLDRIKQANRNLSSKKRGSNNRRKALKELYRVHQKVVNKRRNWFYMLAHELTDKYDQIYLETLNIQEMKQRWQWGRKVSDLAFNEFVQILYHVANKKGVTVFQIDPFYPSTELCHSCGYNKDDISLKDRQWQCPSCHTTHDRDINAAKNIYQVGIATCGGATVRPATAGSSCGYQNPRCQCGSIATNKSGEY